MSTGGCSVCLESANNRHILPPPNVYNSKQTKQQSVDTFGAINRLFMTCFCPFGSSLTVGFFFGVTPFGDRMQHGRSSYCLSRIPRQNVACLCFVDARVCLYSRVCISLLCAMKSRALAPQLFFRK
nr:hypothetical protein [Pandoravirus massiliensis]